MISRRVWIIMIVITLAYALGIALDISPVLRGPEDWRWPRAAVQYWDRVWPLAAAWLATLGWAVVMARGLTRTTRPRRWLMVGLLGLMIASGVVQLRRCGWNGPMWRRRCSGAPRICTPMGTLRWARASPMWANFCGSIPR